MKKIVFLVTIIATVLVSSCDKFDDTEIWEKLENHENRISALEELCKQLNTNINSLKTIVEALEKNDYITNVSPINKDGNIIGYTISFAHSDTITIYNGSYGEDVSTPQIGVKKGSDNIYYWTVNGEWLLDADGNKIKAVGQDGTNGVTPRLKIENNYWYVTYDNGATWIELGKATSEPGDNLFKDIVVGDDYVTFYLNDDNETVFTIPLTNNDNQNYVNVNIKYNYLWDQRADYKDLKIIINGKEYTAIGFYQIPSNTVINLSWSYAYSLFVNTSFQQAWGTASEDVSVGNCSNITLTIQGSQLLTKIE